MERKTGILLCERDDGSRAALPAQGARRPRRHRRAAPRRAPPRSTTRSPGGPAPFDFLIGDVGGVDEIQTSTTFLLMEAARRVDEANEERRRARSRARSDDRRLETRTPAAAGRSSSSTSSCRPSATAGGSTISSSGGSAGCRARASSRSSATQIFFPDGRRPARPSSVRAGETILLRPAGAHRAGGPAPLRDPLRGRQRAGDRQAGRAADAHDRQVLAQHADRAAARALPRASRWRSRTGSIARRRACCWSRAAATAASLLTRAFARRAVDKTYLALVKGQPPDEGRIDQPLKLLDTPDARDDGAGRRTTASPAVTRYRVVRRLRRARALRGAPRDRTPAPDPRPLRSDRPPDRRRQALRRQRGAVHARLRRGGDARAARRCSTASPATRCTRTG